MSDDHFPAVDPRILRAAAEGCTESRILMNRRHMLGVSAGFFAWAFAPKFAVAGSSTDPRLLLVIIRGGMDGLNTVVPFGDPNYAGLRGGIAMPGASTIQLNSFFGMHPSLTTLGSLYGAGQAAVVHATCTPKRNRSHFDAQDNLETGLPADGNTTNATGWLNRLLSALPTGDPIRVGGAVQVGEAPVVLRGPAPVLGWSPTWFEHVNQLTTNNLLGVYDAVDPGMAGYLRRGLTADALAEAVDPNGGSEDISQLRKAFRGAARMMRVDTGPRIAVLSVEGFDTHVDQGGATGQLATRLGELDGGIADFRTEMAAAWAQTVVVCVTEFGRTAAVNGNLGTDHGVGTVALLAGGAVNGGNVFTDWPGLAPQNLYEQSDLNPTTDLRSIFKGVLQDHLGVPKTLLDETIFPSSAAVPVLQNLIRSPASADQIAKSPLVSATAKTRALRGKVQPGWSAPTRLVDPKAAAGRRALGGIAKYRQQFPET